MDAKDFDGVVENRINLIKSVLASKRKEYAKGGDRLHNFKRAAETLRTTPEKALLGMFTKHLVSILDIVDAVETSVPTVGMVEEKIGDAVNYLILLEGLLKERIGYAIPPSVDKVFREDEQVDKEFLGKKS
jgi:hypothetical protein